MGVLEFVVPFHIINTARVVFFFRFEDGPSKLIPYLQTNKLLARQDDLSTHPNTQWGSY